MKSSEFERLGDWQRKQEWGFNDALNDLVNKNSSSQTIPSSCIYVNSKIKCRKSVN